MRVALIGQAAFGEAVYRRLLEQGEDVVGVFYEREGDPLFNLAKEQGIATYQTKDLRSRGFLRTYQDLGADLNVLAFVTVIIPERVLNLPSHGSIQFHPSLLPCTGAAAPSTGPSSTARPRPASPSSGRTGV